MFSPQSFRWILKKWKCCCCINTVCCYSAPSSPRGCRSESLVAGSSLSRVPLLPQKTLSLVATTCMSKNRYKWKTTSVVALNWYSVTYRTRYSFRYPGPRPFRALKVITSISNGHGRQPGKLFLDWHNMFSAATLTSNLDAAFCSTWSFWIVFRVILIFQ